MTNSIELLPLSLGMETINNRITTSKQTDEGTSGIRNDLFVHSLNSGDMRTKHFLLTVGNFLECIQ